MKTEQARVASKYAEALIELAYQAGDKVAESIAGDLNAINEVVASTAEFTIVLNHPAIRSDEKKRLLLSLFEGKVNELTARLVSLLCDKRRLELLTHIGGEYVKLLRTRKNVASATLTSAEPLSDASVASIKTKLTEKLGKQLELDVSVDRSLIGGLMLRVGDQVLDGSLRGKLQVLERTLLSV
jgi:F-type H+-transporting ATPase subunit delta